VGRVEPRRRDLAVSSERDRVVKVVAGEIVGRAAVRERILVHGPR